MAKPPRSRKLLDKGGAALLSAIEVYNKPDFKYREEIFAILLLNAWELLLKARHLSRSGEKISSLYVYETRKTKAGHQSKKRYRRLNRAGNPMTKSLGEVITALDQDPGSRLDPTVRQNIHLLAEIRDNAVHFYNASPDLAHQVLEIGTASIKNFIELARTWFNSDLSRYSLYLLPIGFVGSPQLVTLPRESDEGRLIQYLSNAIAGSSEDAGGPFHLALEVKLSFRRSSDAMTEVRITTDSNAPAVRLSDTDLQRTWPWDYREMVRRCRERYSDFLQNGKFNRIHAKIKQNDKLVRTRYLNPKRKKGSSQNFYSSNVLQEFDKEYARN